MRKMGKFKLQQINFWVLKFLCHSFQMIYITSCAIVLHVFLINSLQMCRYFGFLDHIYTDNKPSLAWSMGHLRGFFFLYFDQQLVKAFYFCRE